MNIAGKLKPQTCGLILRLNVFNFRLMCQTLTPGTSLFSSNVPSRAVIQQLHCSDCLSWLPVCCLCLGGCKVRVWHRDEAGSRGSHESVAHLRSNRHRCGGRPFPGSFWQLGRHVWLLVRQPPQFGWFINWQILTSMSSLRSLVRSCFHPRLSLTNSFSPSLQLFLSKHPSLAVSDFRHIWKCTPFAGDVYLNLQLPLQPAVILIY